MKLILFVLGLWFTCCSVQGQLESPFSKGATFLGMANSGVAEEGSFALFYNQAGITDVKAGTISLNAARLYDNSGLLHLHAGAILPTKDLGNFAIRISNFGIEGYTFQNYTLTYARKLFSNFALSASFNLYQFRIENYGNAFIPNLELGFLSRLSENLSLGAHIANPFPVKLSDRSEVPVIFNVGLRYKVSALVSLNADVEKNINEKQNFKLGLAYQIHPLLVLRGGINSFPSSFYFGAGVKWKDIEINLGNGNHQVLGNSTGVNIVYSIQKI